MISLSTITDNDLQEIKELIKEQNQRISQLEEKFEDKLDKLNANFENRLDKLTDNFENRLDKLTGKVDNLEKGQIKLETQLESVDKRLDNVEFINRTIFGGLILGLY